jgi:hypothetical protein
MRSNKQLRLRWTRHLCIGDPRSSPEKMWRLKSNAVQVWPIPRGILWTVVGQFDPRLGENHHYRVASSRHFISRGRKGDTEWRW